MLIQREEGKVWTWGVSRKMDPTQSPRKALRCFLSLWAQEAIGAGRPHRPITREWSHYTTISCPSQPRRHCPQTRNTTIICPVRFFSTQSDPPCCVPSVILPRLSALFHCVVSGWITEETVPLLNDEALYWNWDIWVDTEPEWDTRISLSSN